MTPPKMADLPLTLHEILSVFATLKLNCPVAKSPCFVTADSGGGKHLRLLNGLALLLVTEAKSDVAAVTISTRPLEGGQLEHVFHLAKNRSCTASEALYYRKFMELINEGRSLDYATLFGCLMDLILDNCRPKISIRAGRIQRAIQDREAYNMLPDEENNLHPWTKAELKDFRKWSGAESVEGISWFELVVGWMKTCLHPQLFEKSIERKPAYLALTKVEKFSKQINLVRALGLPRLERQVGKLAMYVQALRKILRQVQHPIPSAGAVYRLKLVSFLNKNFLHSMSIEY